MLDFEAEAYSTTGNIAADGIRRLLGNPDMDRLETVLREAIQNSWDAGRDCETPECRIRVRELTYSEMDTLREQVFVDISKDRASLESLRQRMNSRTMRVLEIADFGTDGLGGHTDPSCVPEEGESSDFVDFIRNIGTPRDTMFGGGTYGYGKSSLYVASSCRTIIVDSVTEYLGRPERRLMVCNISQMYDVREGSEKGRYTGRHWWGQRDKKGVLHPMTNEMASEIAKALGFPTRSMDERGTTIMILDPDLPEEYSDERLAPAMVGTLLANFWPKMVERGTGGPPMAFGLSILGRNIEIPHPRDVPPLGLFVEALQQVREKKGQEIRSLRPRKLLGNLSCIQDMRLHRLQSVIWPHTAPFSEVSHHVALMRPAELIVKYLPGGVLGREGIEWGGVFAVDDKDKEVEQAFALSEPPAHDDWVPSNMEKGRQKTMVNVGLKRIRELINRFGAAPVEPAASGEGEPLAVLADRLGGSLLSGPGQRLGGGRKGGRAGSSGRLKRRRGRLNIVFAGFEWRNGRRCSRYSIECGDTDSGYLLRGDPEVLLDDRKTVEVAPNGGRPRVLGWYDKSGNEISTADSFQVPAQGGEYSVLVSMPDMVAVRLRLVRREGSADEY